MSTLPNLHTLNDVAKSLGMSERWLRQQCKDGAEHTRLGHKIRFTDEQVAALVAKNAAVPVAQSITTGRRRSA
jgi:hypothetical protein